MLKLKSKEKLQSGWDLVWYEKQNNGFKLTFKSIS